MRAVPTEDPSCRRRSIAEAYLQGEASRFFPSHFADPAARRRAVEQARRPVHPALLAELRRQNGRWAPSPARDAHLEALASGAVAVVTGQQVGLFLGPLYTVYKAASAIRVARSLAEESGLPVVPIFWLQTEDHDLLEIAEVGVPGAAGSWEQLRLPAAADARISVKHQALPPETERCLARLREAIGHLPHAEEHLRHLEGAYRSGAPWTEAFASLLAALFAEEGLILLDPREAAVARLAAPLHRRALVEAEGIAEGLAGRVRELEAAGFAASIHVRPGAPLGFFHPEGPEGPRFRLERRGAAFCEVGGGRSHGQEALLKALEADPLRFSTSALLRPLLQDSLLPTAAYVGGPGELAYFAQLAPLYEHFGLPMPLVVPRNHFRVVDAACRGELEALGLEAGDFRLPVDELLRRDAVDGDAEALERELLEAFETSLDRLAPRLLAAGEGVATGLRKTRSSVRRSVARLRRRYERARLWQDREKMETLSTLREFFFPGGVPQERVHGLAAYAARFGERAFLTAVLEAVQPFDPTPRDIHL